MSQVFISYSRRDTEFVKSLAEAFKKQERDIWVDWEDIPLTADWLEEIYDGIEGADNFAFVISPDSINSDVCAKELEYAVQHKKRLVPLLHREVGGGLRVHDALSSHNWIF